MIFIVLLLACLITGEAQGTVRKVSHYSTTKGIYYTIQSAINVSNPGDSISIAHGIYYEHLEFPRSGTLGAPIKLTGQSGAILDGRDTLLEHQIKWTLTVGPGPDKASVWTSHLAYPYFSSNHHNPKVWRDSLHFYEFDSPEGVRTGIEKTPYWTGPITEGYFADWDGTLWIRSLDDPALHKWFINPWSDAIYLHARDFIQIKGLTFRYYTWSIWVTGSQQVLIQGCRFQTTVGIEVHDFPDEMFPDSGTTRRSTWNTISGNVLADPPQGTWTYQMTKGTTMERFGIGVQGGEDVLIEGNDVSCYHDGIVVNSTLGVLVKDNYVHHVSDDGIECDGDGEYTNIWNNIISDCNNGISLAPINIGPVLVYQNLISRYIELGIKGSAVDWTGPVFLRDNVLNP